MPRSVPSSRALRQCTGLFKRLHQNHVERVSGRDKLSGASTIPSFFRRDFKAVDSGATDLLAVSPGGPSSPRFANQNHHVREISQGLSKVCVGRAAARMALIGGTVRIRRDSNRPTGRPFGLPNNRMYATWLVLALLVCMLVVRRRDAARSGNRVRFVAPLRSWYVWN